MIMRQNLCRRHFGRHPAPDAHLLLNTSVSQCEASPAIFNSPSGGLRGESLYLVIVYMTRGLVC
jgi:hypothetical protein